VPVLVGDHVVRVVEDPHVTVHPRVDAALVLDRRRLRGERAELERLPGRDGRVVVAVVVTHPEEVVGNRGRVLHHHHVARAGGRGCGVARVSRGRGAAGRGLGADRSGGQTDDCGEGGREGERTNTSHGTRLLRW